MSSKEKAELFFKQERLPGGGSSIPEYEQRARAERAKTARLRVLRLARQAESVPKLEETGGAKEKLTQHNPPNPSYDALDKHRNLSVDVRKLRHCRTEIPPFEGWSPSP